MPARSSHPDDVGAWADALESGDRHSTGSVGSGSGNRRAATTAPVPTATAATPAAAIPTTPDAPVLARGPPVRVPEAAAATTGSLPGAAPPVQRPRSSATGQRSPDWSHRWQPGPGTVARGGSWRAPASVRAPVTHTPHHSPAPTLTRPPCLPHRRTADLLVDARPSSHPDDVGAWADALESGDRHSTGSVGSGLGNRRAATTAPVPTATAATPAAAIPTTPDAPVLARGPPVRVPEAAAAATGAATAAATGAAATGAAATGAAVTGLEATGLAVPGAGLAPGWARGGAGLGGCTREGGAEAAAAESMLMTWTSGTTHSEPAASPAPFSVARRVRDPGTLLCVDMRE